MSDIKLHVRNTEDGQEHVIDCPPDIKAADFIAELIEGLHLPAADWVLDDEECAATLDPRASLISNGVANGHHLRLRRNGTDLQKAPHKHVTPEEPPAKGRVEEYIEPPPVKKVQLDDDRKLWQWLTASLALIVLLLLLVAAVRWLLLVPPRIAVTLTPKNATVLVSERARFTVVVKGTRNQEVRWTLNPALGNIAPDGVYAAPPLAEPGQTVVITATSVADPSRSATARIVLRPNPQIQISPATATLGVSQRIQFAASVTGATNGAVHWSISPQLGTIAPDGTYTAPASIPSANTVTVTATSEADPSKSTTATISLQPTLPSTVLSVQVSPYHPSLTMSEQMLFRARVNGSTNQRVTWSASAGSITQGGAYTAPSSIEAGTTATIMARSVADPSKVGRAVVDLQSVVTLRIGPSSVTLPPSQRQQQFTAFVTGTSNDGVRWSATAGTITPSGLFTAPEPGRVPQSVRITATSVADPTKQAWAAIVVAPGTAPRTPEGGGVGGPHEATGLILWSGMLDAGGLLTIEGFRASTGQLLRGGLPGVPVTIDVGPLELVGVQEAPGPANGWKKLVIRSKRKLHAVITIEWKVVH